MKFLKELEENNVILLILASEQYNKTCNDVAGELSGKKVVYINFNKTYFSLKEMFEKKGVDLTNFVFVDGITKTIKNTADSTEGCYYVTSPQALTEISIKLSKLLNHRFDFVIFDSITNLLTYNNKNNVIKFVSNTVARVKENKTKSIFYALSLTEQEAIIKEVGMFADKIINLSK